ncbi:MAG TPA: VWA domain-containing protein [Pyrinomonadaceae bacterium]|nr:VWA domain-containing protein [Pyrinomonadaceae bacterium]
MIRLFYFSRPTSALLLAVLIFSLSIFAQTEDEVLTVDSSTVLLNATILDNNGKSATGLKREQFSVFENGVQQQISYFSAAETPFAAVILIDTSGSMESRISIARAAAINFLTGLRANDSAAIYRFSSKVELIQDFSGSQDINESVFELRADGMTALNDSIFKSAEELKKRPEKRRAIIVLSDGEDTSSGKSADKALKTALDAGALIYTIDMSSMDSNTRQRVQNQGILRNFAEKSGGKFVATPGGAALRQAFKGIVDELGIQYTLGYEPTNLQKDGKWRAIELRVARPNLTIRTRKGYNASK